MDCVNEITVSLRISGVDLDPDEATRILGCEPVAVYRKGERVSPRSKQRTRDGGWWLDSGLPKDASLDEHVARILSRVSQDEAVWRTLEKFQPEILVEFYLRESNIRATLSPRYAETLGKFGIRLLLDISWEVEGWQKNDED